MKELLGFTAQAILIDKAKELLVFYNSSQSYIYYADSECCSNSYFECVLNPEVLIGVPVLSITDKKFETIMDDEDDVCIKGWGVMLNTSLGYCDIEFRNASNGFYGGSCELLIGWKLVLNNNKVSIDFTNVTDAQHCFLNKNLSEDTVTWKVLAGSI